MNNFSNVPVDPDTRIIKQSEITINSIPVLKQKWNFDGVIGNSIIFKSPDVSNFSDAELLEFIKENSEIQINGSVTFKRNDNGYCFFNYNFEAS